MLKKKMQTLAKENSLSTQSNFEIINDDSASEVLGGVENCTVLQNCGTYDGSCSSLLYCKAFGVQ